MIKNRKVKQVLFNIPMNIYERTLKNKKDYETLTLVLIRSLEEYLDRIENNKN